MHKFILFLIIFQVLHSSAQILTPYELKGYNYTPTYSESIAFCKEMDKLSRFVKYSSIGYSSRGFEIPLLIVDKNGYEDVNKIRRKDRAIVLIIASIHAGESDGKDALFLLLRDIVEKKKEVIQLLDSLSLLLIPIFNVDGDNRYGPYNRINQNGPEQCGWRTNSRNLNLNRDFLKVDTKEMRNFLKFYHKWRPDFIIDCHTTNGADYQYLLTYAIETGYYTHPLIAKWNSEYYLPFILSKMEEHNILTFPYISFRNWHDVETSVMHYPSPPYISNGYFSITNRPGLLIETHMLKSYRKRVEANYLMILESLRFVAEQKNNLFKIIKIVDQQMKEYENFAIDFPIEITLKEDSVLIDFKGVKYEKKYSDLTGSYYFKFYSDQPEIWKRYFYDKQAVNKKITLPYFYIIPPEWEDVADRLIYHGIKYCVLEEEINVKTRMIKFENVKFADKPYEGRQKVKYEIKEFDTLMVFPAGSFLIPTSQEMGRIIAYILEPASPFSYVSWGFFNSIFEQKEYAEIYIMEEIAQKIIEKDSSFYYRFLEEKKLNLPEFSTHWGIIQWLYRQTPWYDPLLNVYPIGRIYDYSLIKSIRCSASVSKKDKNLNIPFIR